MHAGGKRERDDGLLWAFVDDLITRSVGGVTRFVFVTSFISSSDVCTSISFSVLGVFEDGCGTFVCTFDDDGGIIPCTTWAAVRRLLMSWPCSLRASLQVRPM